MHMSQERLAERLGITFQQVQKYERGVNRVSASRLWGIAQAHGVTPDRLFDALIRDWQVEGNRGEPVSGDEWRELGDAMGRIQSVHLRRVLVDLATQLAAEPPKKDEDWDLRERSSRPLASEAVLGPGD